jgi:membrane-bound lytic murein transglycosylase B
MRHAASSVLARLAIAALLMLAGELNAAEYSSRPDVTQFIDEMAQKHGFVRPELQAVFSRARRQNSVLRAMQAPAESPRRSWQAYRSLFLNPQRIEAGARFRAANAEVLARASAMYGVPEEIIAAIIGVETVYGRNVGTYRVIDALATLAFDFPARSEYFRSELEQFLLHAREENLDVFATRGSYAGAIGIPQFMPGTYRRFAVDFDGDGHRDLRGSVADAIGSVANFLKEHGWQTGRPIAARAAVTGDAYRPLLDGGVKPAFRLGDLAAVGVNVTEAVDPDEPCALVELETPGQPAEYWAAFENFFVITRYNRSALYATAVLQLARALQPGGTPVR